MVRFLMQPCTHIESKCLHSLHQAHVRLFLCIIDGLICGKILASLGQIEPTLSNVYRPWRINEFLLLLLLTMLLHGLNVLSYFT